MRWQQENQEQATGSSTDAANGAAEGAADTAANGADGSFDFTNLDAETLTGLALDYGIPALKVVVIFFLAWIIAAWVRRLTSRGLERARMEPTVARFTGNLARWAILALALVAILGIFGIPTATFAAVIGAFGLALGLALQGTLGNGAAGFLLLVFRPFKVGDVVNAAGVSGKVVEIELFTTMIDTFDNRRFIVPNGSIFGQTIENISHHPTRRVDVAVGVEYDADLQKTRDALTEAVMGLEQKLDDPAPAVVLSELADSSVNWVVRVWVNADDFWPVKEQLTARIKNALDAAHIGIPFPQMDVHLKGAAPDGRAA